LFVVFVVETPNPPKLDFVVLPKLNPLEAGLVVEVFPKLNPLEAGLAAVEVFPKEKPLVVVAAGVVVDEPKLNPPVFAGVLVVVVPVLPKLNPVELAGLFPPNEKLELAVVAEVLPNENVIVQGRL